MYNIYIYIYIYVYIHTYIKLYIYIYIYTLVCGERERERGRERDAVAVRTYQLVQRESYTGTLICHVHSRAHVPTQTYNAERDAVCMPNMSNQNMDYTSKQYDILELQHCTICKAGK